MHQIFAEIPKRIIENAKCALAQANMHAAFYDPGNEHWGNMSVVNAAHAGELFMKAVIAEEHPLLIFKNIFDFDDNSSNEIQLDRLLQKAKTHDFQHLPKILWAVKKVRVPDMTSFEKVRTMRNAIQHFYHPAGIEDVGMAAKDASLEFIYKNIDPLIYNHFGLFAIDYHEDHSVGYDHLVGCIAANGLKFSMPEDFNITEIDLAEAISKTSDAYKAWMRESLRKIDREDLLRS